MTSGRGRELVFVVPGDITVIESGARRRFREAFDFLTFYFDDIILYSFYTDLNRPWDDAAIARFAEEFPKVRLVLDRKTSTHQRVSRLKQTLMMIFPGSSQAIIKLALPWLCPAFDALKKSLRDPCFFVCGVSSLSDLNGMPKAAIVADTLDLRFVHWAICKNLPVHHWRVIARMRMEIAQMSCCDALVAISRSEAAFLKILSPQSDCFFVPSFQDEPKRSPAKAKTGYDIDLLFVGTDYHFNLLGLMTFLTANQPWLKALRIAIAGTVSLHSQVVELAKTWPKMRLLGFVDELAPLYARTKLAISPVEGTGLKVKILEALRHGTPVVASASSMDGLPGGYQNCVFQIDRASIEHLLNKPVMLLEAEQATQAYLSDGCFTEQRDALQRYLHTKLHRQLLLPASNAVATGALEQLQSI